MSGLHDLPSDAAGASRFRPSPRGLAEGAATTLIVTALVMMVQPVWLELFSYSFVVMLAGTALFIVGSKLPE